MKGTVLGFPASQNKEKSNVSNLPKSANKKKKKKNNETKQIKKSHVIKTERDDLNGFTSEEEEDEEDYRKGGYHPVQIGNTYNQRYKVTKKLGWGHFSTVWLANDLSTDKNIALKIVKSAKHYTEAAKDEISILKKVTTEDPNDEMCVVHLVDSFEHYGPHGNHVCMAFENLGCNLLTVIKMYKYKGLPVPLVKIITKQLLIGLDFLHKNCSIIHTDLKPENILLLNYPKILKKEKTDEEFETIEPEDEKSEKKNGKKRKTRHNFILPKSKEEVLESFKDSFKCKIVDLGNACWTHKHFTDDVQTRQYRAPEIILGYNYGTAIDMWSMACIIFELLTGDLLFEPKSGKDYQKNDDHLAQIIELLGKMPKDFATNGSKSSNYFNRKGELKKIQNLTYWGIEDVLIEKYRFTPSEAEIISDFLKPMLEYIPSNRANASTCLKHKWIRDVDVNNFESAFTDLDNF